MRGFVLVLFAAVPLFGGTVYTSTTCDGVTNGGNYPTAGGTCGSGTGGSTGSSAEASLAEMYVYATAWAGYDTPDSSGATASLTQDFILTVTGGQGDGYAETEGLYASGQWRDAENSAFASVSLGECSFGSGSDVEPPQYCQVPFVFGVPQTLTFSETASASAGPYTGLAGATGSAGGVGGFLFFDDYGQQLSGVTYSFVATDQPPSGTPEPRTLPLLTAMACAAFIAFKLRRGSPAC